MERPTANASISGSQTLTHGPQQFHCSSFRLESPCSAGFLMPFPSNGIHHKHLIEVWQRSRGKSERREPSRALVGVDKHSGCRGDTQPSCNSRELIYCRGVQKKTWTMDKRSFLFCARCDNVWMHLLFRACFPPLRAGIVAQS